ncbi:uroporphyrinogen-III C-methyltransferase [Catenovulum maritimum]|uniref:Uroporphyrin-III methyltransferase n=1 Tax=Catenovulum maritimum TaxID=1513271 RepID=A0A0J8GU38_9ALTE|nr:uroporphyrinogen-III C-methyltransferase [Catenovulum maritimum]KMT66257.1 hypothetical protein XM47_04495 [Catenovulum maritimum]
MTDKKEEISAPVELRVEATSENTIPHSKVEAQAKPEVEDKPESGISYSGIFALLIAACAAGLSGWLYWQQTQLEALLDQRQSAVLNAVENSQEAINHDITRRLDTLSQKLNDDIDKRNQDTQIALDQISSKKSTSTEESVLIDVKYLITLASRKLYIEQDKQSTIATLRLAQARANDISSASWFQLKQIIADDIGTVESINEADIEGIFFTITELIRQVMFLPLNESQLPKLTQEIAQKEITDTPSMSNLTNSFEDFLESFLPKKREATAEAMLTPAQEANIRQNLISKLNQVQWAALHRKQQVYRVGIQQTLDWITLYYQKDDPAIKNILVQLAGLHEQELNRNYNLLKINSLIEAEKLLVSISNNSNADTNLNE